MKKLILILSIISVFSLSSFAQEEEESNFSMGVSMNTDAFFGYAPAAFGAYSLSDGLDFTFYGIFWSPGTGQGFANWTEFGVGVNFPVGDLSINPAIGILAGNLLNSFASAQPSLGDGIVPNLTLNYGSDVLEGNFYLGYYAGLSEGELPGGAGAAVTTTNWLHYWASVGYKVTDWFSVGPKYEQLNLAGGSDLETAGYETGTTYAALGGYVQFADPNGGSYLSFFGATNIADQEAPTFIFETDSFWKMTVGFNF